MKMNKDIKLVSNLKIKGVTDDKDEDIIVEGYANTTTKDRVGDVIVESAWTGGGLDNYLKNPILLAYHDHKHPVGLMTDYGVNNKGLHITGRITKAAGDVYDLVKSGVLQAFSVGFRVKDADYDVDTDIFVIKDLELHEISVVSVPANADSLFSVAKSFEDENEYNEFKNSFIEVEEKNDSSTDNKGDTNVPKIEDGNITLTPEELAAKTQKAIDEALAKAKATEIAEKEAEDKIKATAIAAGETGAERLLAEVEKRFSDTNAEMLKSIEGLQTELKDKSAEIEAMTKSKMSFVDKDDMRKATEIEIDTAVIVAKALGRSIEETKYFKDHLIEKAVGGGAHIANMDDKIAYETIYSDRMYEEIQDKLVVEPLLMNKIQMNSRAMVFPYNPEAGVANWVADTAYHSSDGSSTGSAHQQVLEDISITAHKLASKESVGYEEEEDAIIPIVPIIRSAIARRMARTTDTELLRADATVETVSGQGAALINGLATFATDDSCQYVQSGAFGTTNPVTVADLQSTRRAMGTFGLNPKDVTYVVNESVYYDLLEDPDFRTMDLVGQNATILNGQIGSVNGSPVVVSDSFATPAIDGVAAIAVNTSNYIFGELRGLMTENDRDILNQKNWIVTTRRFAFNEIQAGTATKSSCSALLYPAS